MGTTRGWVRRGFTVAVIAALVAGCTSAGAGQPNPAPAGPEQVGPLARFYRQVLKWELCEQFLCARLTVPIDYAHPDGGTFSLPLKKAPATKPDQRIGTVVAGAGGPGQSGVAMVEDIGENWPAPVRERFDVVSFDPRGVGGSEPKLRCDTQGEPTGPVPANLPLIGPAVPRQRQFAEACLAQTGENVVRHLGSADVVSDLDVLRAVTGQEKLTYVGFSYGTRVGQLYADRFPNKIRAMVLDGVDNLYLDWREDPVQQAEGADLALHAYAKECAARTGKPCPGKNEGEILATVDRVLAGPDGDSLRSVIGTKVPFPAEWPALSEELIAAESGTAADDSGEDSDDEEDPEKSDDTVLAVVNCLDRPHPTDLAAYEETARRLRAVSPVNDGSELASCAFLPTSTVRPKTVRAEGAPPVLLVGTTVDAATPYRWAEALSESMPSAVLLTNDDVGHAVYGGTSPCVDADVDRYLIDLIPPPAPARCTTGSGG
ncbi:alpha/beta hydrolase [Amycolatopsis sp. CA-230715]|uniref:alpha/beta hydrolase n=1 Tax=Amycolatopsis sp. CA-230715 TaxID=2745196 RepID=UPI001C02EA0D|nr:alpha/beta hydrolase [Amycolatopsis sp. CA-230715]QWF78842.1 Carboxylesterase A [Amycolatopsis sp. CA-230715]